MSKSPVARFLFSSLILAICFIPEAALTQVATPADSCSIIHRYESYCDHLTPAGCIRYRQGFDYWHNSEHQKTWDDFYNLCGQVETRNSHACIAHLGIGTTCTSTVEAPPEPVSAYRAPPVELRPYSEPSVVYNPPVEHCFIGTPCASSPTTNEPPIPVPSPSVPEDISTPESPARIPNPEVPYLPPDSHQAAAPAPEANEGKESIGEVAAGVVAPGPFASAAIVGSGCSFQPNSGLFDASAYWLVSLFLSALALSVRGIKKARPCGRALNLS